MIHSETTLTYPSLSFSPTLTYTSLSFSPTLRKAQFIGGPYSGKGVSVPTNTVSIRLTWKDNGEQAGIYRWDEDRHAFVWEQISGRPCEPLPD